MKTEVLEKAIELRKQFQEIYSQTGIISVQSDNGIHVTTEALFSIPGKVKREQGTDTFPVQLVKEYGGERFFAIMKDFSEYTNLLLEAE